MAQSPTTFTSHSPPRAQTLSGPATRRRSTRELLQTRNRAFGPNGVPTTSRQTSATRTDTTSRLPISLGSTNKRYEPSSHPEPEKVPATFSEPSWFILAKNDHTVHPELQRFVAKRMNATVHEVASSHVAMLSNPKFVIDVIRTAANA